MVPMVYLDFIYFTKVQFIVPPQNWLCFFDGVPPPLLSGKNRTSTKIR